MDQDTTPAPGPTGPTQHGADFEIRDITPDDREWVRRVLKTYWASTVQVSRGRLVNADELPGFIAMQGGEPVGLLTYDINGKECEIVTHNSLAGQGGVGSCLLAAVRTKARELGCDRLWLVTTNDNTPSLRFYQRRDFDMVALHRNAVKESRSLKRDIPEVGLDGIRLRHEIEMEYLL